MANFENLVKEIEALEHGDIFSSKREIKLLPELLFENERICAVALGSIDTTTYVIFLTNERILFLNKGLLWGVSKLEIPLSQIKTVESETGWFFGKITLGLGRPKKVIDHIVNAQTNSFYKAINIQIHSFITQKASGKAKIDADSNSTNDSMDLFQKLDSLNSLRDKGKLTREEYFEKKDKLLSA